MSLGAKIKDALTGSSHTETPPEDRNVPGSFPTDDVPSHGAAVQGSPDLAPSGSVRNKLHKPNDPRGDMPTSGHGHTDSGVGLTEPHAQESIERKPVAAGFAGHDAPRHEHQQAPFTQHNTGTHEQAGDGHNAARMAETERGEAGAFAPAKHTHDQDRHEEPNVARTGLGATSSTAHKDPYWGDIAPGTGVYNTVTGHGSAEDANRRDGSHAHEAHPGNDTGHRAFPIGGTQHHEEETRHDNSRSKQAAAGTAGVAGTALAAHELDKKHDDRATGHSREEDRVRGDASHDSKDHKESKLAGLFHRDHKEGKEHHPETKREERVDESRHHQKEGGILGLGHRDHKDDKEAKHEAKHEAKQAEREDKHSHKKDDAAAAAASAYAAHAAAEEHDRKKAADKKAHDEQPKEKKESKLHALFHRSSNDHDDEPSKEGKHLSEHRHQEHQAAGFAPQTQHRHETQPRSTGQDQYQPQQTDAGSAPWRDEIGTGDKHSNLGRGAAAAGTGGAAAYGASRLAHKDGNAPRATDRDGNVPPATTLASTQQAQRQTYPAPGQYDSTAPGPPFSDTHQSGMGGQSHGAPAGAIAAGLPTRQPEHNTHQHEHARQPQHSQNEQYDMLPSGAASGVPRHAEATHQREPTHQHDPTRQSKHSHDDKYDVPASGTASGVPRHSEASHQHESTRQPEPSRHHESSRQPEHSQDGEYNVLPSGTVSGVKVGNDNHHGQGPTTAPQSSTESQQGGHRAAPMAAAAGAAGVGAAAYSSRHGEGEQARDNQQTSRFAGQTQPKEHMDSKPSQPPAAYGMPSGPTGSGQKVIHQCNKCGEPNDISHYFSK